MKAIVLLPCILFMASSALGEETIFEDKFERSGPIQGTAPELVNQRGVIWKDNLVGLGKEGLNTNGKTLIVDKTDLVALPIGFSKPPPNSMIILSADITNSSQWIMIGFSGNRNLFDPETGAVSCVQLWGNGRLVAIKGRSKEKLESSHLFDDGRSVHIEISYNTIINKATIKANSFLIASFTYETPPHFNLACIQGIVGSNGSIDNFTLKVNDISSGSEEN